MSTLAFRNVDVTPNDPVSEWPLEAIQTARVATFKRPAIWRAVSLPEIE